MRLGQAECRTRFATARVARLATVGGDARPHLVPVVFAVSGDRLVMAVDQKPKSTTSLRRVRNIVANRQVSLLVDYYDEDWTRLWWVRVDGVGGMVNDPADREAALDLLVAKYVQYRDAPPLGPVIEVRITTWSGWAAGR